MKTNLSIKIRKTSTTNVLKVAKPGKTAKFTKKKETSFRLIEALGEAF